MSKKTLLSESTIRQFMKYANIGGLTDGFINETYGDYRREDEPMMEAEEEEELELGGDEAPMDDAPPMDDMDMGAEIGDTSEASIEALVDALADTITQVTGVEVSAAGDGMDDPPMDAMDDMGDMGDDEPVADVEMVDDEEIVAETMKRVTRRLRGMKKQRTRDVKRDALIENVASRIAKRLKIK